MQTSAISTLSRFWLGVVLCVALPGAFASAESYSVTLTPTLQNGVGGGYLSSPFDFGTQFSQIDSVKVVFTMPAGFAGSIWSTGNSSGSQMIGIQIHDESQVLDLPLTTNPADDTYAWLFNVAAGTPTEIPFMMIPVLDGESAFPAFWSSGSGKVDFVVLSSTYYHPINGPPESYSSSHAWLTPVAISSATLTIEGTAVPEPHSVGLTMILAAMALAVRRRRR
jgi:hypothetical protein